MKNINRPATFTVRFCSALCLLCQVFFIASAYGAVDAFDTNHNGLIEPGQEITSLLERKSTVTYAEIDTNHDGRIDQQELTALNRKLENAIAMKLAEYNDLIAGRDGMTYDEVNQFIEGSAASPAGKKSWVDNLLIRKDYENAGVTGPDKKAANGATIAYAKDYQNKNDVWQVRGTLMYKDRVLTGLSPSGKESGITAYSFVPGVSFDRVSNSSRTLKSRDINALVFRLGSEVEYMNGPLFASQYWRANLDYATDFDFRSKIAAVEAEWEPVNNYIGMGTGHMIFGEQFEIRWRGVLHAEAGKVFDTGDKTNIVDDEGFFRAGPKLMVDLWPKFLDRVSLGFNWQYMKGFDGHPDHTRLFEADLNYALNDAGNYALNLDYRKGRLPLTFEKVDNLTLGLTVKY